VPAHARNTPPASTCCDASHSLPPHHCTPRSRPPRARRDEAPEEKALKAEVARLKLELESFRVADGPESDDAVAAQKEVDAQEQALLELQVRARAHVCVRLGVCLHGVEGVRSRGVEGIGAPAEHDTHSPGASHAGGGRQWAVREGGNALGWLLLGHLHMCMPAHTHARTQVHPHTLHPSGAPG